MKLSELKMHLSRANAVNFIQPDGIPVPAHFHITEAGLVSKHFIDCGGTVRTEKAISLQIWSSKDTDHRLEPEKLLKIISIAEKFFGSEDLTIEAEYQTDTVGKYGLEFNGEDFRLTAKQTDCLAKENCGAPQNKEKLYASVSEASQPCCAPGGGCC